MNHAKDVIVKQPFKSHIGSMYQCTNDRWYTILGGWTTHWHDHVLPPLLYLEFIMSLTWRDQQVIHTLIVHLHYGHLQTWGCMRSEIGKASFLVPMSSRHKLLEARNSSYVQIALPPLCIWPLTFPCRSWRVLSLIYDYTPRCKIKYLRNIIQKTEKTLKKM